MRCVINAGVSALAVAVLAGSAAAVDFQGGDLQLRAHFDLGAAGVVPVQRGPQPAAYSNTTNFLGQALANGGGAASGAGGAFITRLVADDLTPIGGFGGGQITQVTFSVANLNTATVTVRPRIRFWFADGAGGAPGTYYNGASPAANVGFTFNPIAVPTGVSLFNFAPAANSFLMPGGTFWAGMTFDSDNGAGGNTGATLAQINNFGQGIFGPPTVGSSTDRVFQTTAAGSFFPTANPAGTNLNGAGNPSLSLGWEFLATPVPAPGSMGLLAVAGIVAGRRRRA